MNKSPGKRALVSEARFRAGLWLQSDLDSGAVDSVKERYPHLSEADLVAIEREIQRIASLLISGRSPR